MRKLLTCLVILASGPLAAQDAVSATAPGASAGTGADAAPVVSAQAADTTEQPAAQPAARAGAETPPEPAAQATDGIFPAQPPETVEELRWIKRVVAVFADSPNDPLFRRQMEALERDPAPLAFRDVVVLTDTDPAADSALRQTFRPRGFMLVLVGKDGQIKLRKPLPWDVRELSRAIDKSPLRQQELRDLGQRGGVAIGR
ncbi:DUF4174 domain-containing protein [Pseudooceanicola nitratireducens]|uniref:DUF4174 domain-containing protein n=1 Tax=Pseudooceanicola nitratireducens TaxID=517719 RepID=UPI001C9862B4|nr:DUF4174 domain-containing protein [Pseudooceanicola nitratireducens]MBY6156306.1 DUF4174 domain-containing protein [Pseudooceanicola nitratireducens]